MTNFRRIEAPLSLQEVKGILESQDSKELRVQLVVPFSLFQLSITEQKNVIGKLAVDTTKIENVFHVVVGSIAGENPKMIVNMTIEVGEEGIQELEERGEENNHLEVQNDSELEGFTFLTAPLTKQDFSEMIISDEDLLFVISIPTWVMSRSKMQQQRVVMTAVAADFELENFDFTVSHLNPNNEDYYLVKVRVIINQSEINERKFLENLVQTKYAHLNRKGLFFRETAFTDAEMTAILNSHSKEFSFLIELNQEEAFFDIEESAMAILAEVIFAPGTAYAPQFEIVGFNDLNQSLILKVHGVLI